MRKPKIKFKTIENQEPQQKNNQTVPDKTKQEAFGGQNRSQKRRLFKKNRQRAKKIDFRLKKCLNKGCRK